ncbi:Checkpoint protein rad17 [Neolecta irregularis DAH-3]|uniref:Checkpoint protein rad17 n=1 Tax=Neolecta irregularis (strain DAH-3) TaxID=1198029 RepID=A0A1U7LWW7_NEOID|nr:Checkpoint protein rad17 [Neolecta irregularis DAH-3]|eukprot:OLL27042.1 Checkpoint protein rad17 [Neolecta irregularis DAH-3]
MPPRKRTIIAISSAEDVATAPPLKKLRTTTTQKKLPAKRRPQRRKAQPTLVIDELNDAISSDGETSIPRASQTNSSQYILRQTLKFPDTNNVAATATDGILWTERYRPDLSTLAIHKKKIESVQKWIDMPSSKILILSGPAGSGKTATVESILQGQGIAKLEWENPMFRRAADEHESLISKFQEFLIRGERYPNLITEKYPHTDHRKVIIIEDIPNTFCSPDSKQSFRKILNQFIYSTRSNFPLVIIISTTETPDQSDNLTPHSLIGSEILSKCMHIEFNPIAKTYIQKALLQIIEKESLGLLEPEYISAISESGDIRSAINTLQFQTIGSQKSKRKFAKRKKGERVLLSTIDQELVSFAERDVKVDAFHAFGKIVYNRRIGDDPEDPPHPPMQGSLPDHLSSWARRKSKVDIEELLSNLTVDVSTFLNGIFENYVLSCSTIGEISSTLESLSQTDFPIPYNLRAMESLLASSTIRSILLNLPSPVLRLKKDNKLYWPEVSRVLKQRDNSLEDLGGKHWSTSEKYGGLGRFGREKLGIVKAEKRVIEKETEEEIYDLIEDF